MGDHTHRLSILTKMKIASIAHKLWIGSHVKRPERFPNKTGLDLLDVGGH